MCRQLITLLRRAGLHSVLPLDQHVTYHKTCGLLLAVLASVHTVCHLLNLQANLVTDTVKNSANYSYTEWLFSTRPAILGTIPGYGYPTGVPLVIVLSVMVSGALPVIRRRGYFEMFYWTHLTYVLFLSLQCLHSPTGLYWTILPGLVFLLCKLQTFLALCLGEASTVSVSSLPLSGYRHSLALEATALQSTVTRLVLEREFQFTAGDYVFINIPAISMFEWHPFTISSPPEEEGVFSLHVRGVGGWTRALHRLVRSGPSTSLREGFKNNSSVN